MDTMPLPSLFRLLSEPIRLRVLGVLDQAELAVSELARVLGLSASRLGNHLRLLRESGVIADRREGNWIFVRLSREGAAWPKLWEALREAWSETPEWREDQGRLLQVLEERRTRSRSYFDHLASAEGALRADFTTGLGRERLIASLLPKDLVVADVGSGQGYLAQSLYPLVRKVILIDHSQAMLKSAEAQLSRDGAELEFRQGEIDALPLKDGEVDAIVCSMVLHHAPDLMGFYREAHRALRPHGRFAILDLLPHREVSLREQMADLRLGLDPDRVVADLLTAGFENCAVEHIRDAYAPELPGEQAMQLPIFLVRCERPNS